MNSGMLFCKDLAKTGSSCGGKQATEYLLGATISGYPAARKRNIDNQHAAYKACMEWRGCEYLGVEKPSKQATIPSQMPELTPFRLSI